jgi:hypothetical protein
MRHKLLGLLVASSSIGTILVSIAALRATAFMAIAGQVLVIQLLHGMFVQLYARRVTSRALWILAATSMAYLSTSVLQMFSALNILNFRFAAVSITVALVSLSLLLAFVKHPAKYFLSDGERGDLSGAMIAGYLLVLLIPLAVLSISRAPTIGGQFQHLRPADVPLIVLDFCLIFFSYITIRAADSKARRSAGHKRFIGLLSVALIFVTFCQYLSEMTTAGKLCSVLFFSLTAITAMIAWSSAIESQGMSGQIPASDSK